MTDLSPVFLEHTLTCKFKQKPCGHVLDDSSLCGKPKSNKIHVAATREHKFKRQNGCATCDKPKNDPDHLGAPESFNMFTHGSWGLYQAAKVRWHKVLVPLLEDSGLSGGLGSVLVEGEVSFGDEKKRDQGNHRVLIEKALGDVLVEMGYLPDDAWEHYEFGGLVRREEPGVNRIRLMILPSSEPNSSAQSGVLALDM